MELELSEGNYNVKFVTNEDKPKFLYLKVLKDETIFVRFLTDEEKNIYGMSD